MLSYKKITSLLVGILLSIFGTYANMAAPWIKGSKNSEAYLSRKINILHEQINISISDLQTADFEIIYTIKPDISGRQIPIIFDDYQDYYSEEATFKVWLDTKEVNVSRVKDLYNDSIKKKWSQDLRIDYPQNLLEELYAFKYFEIDLNKDSIHKIRVKYTGRATIDLSHPVCEFVFEYNLHPAKYWKDFGNLHITIDASNVSETYLFSLSDTTSYKGVQKWHFNNIPDDEFSIRFRPQINKAAQILIKIDPSIFAIVAAILCTLFHTYLMYKYREKQPSKKFSPIAFWGSLIVPLIFCIVFYSSFYFFDWVIGKYASGRHGYIFLIFFVYPFIWIGYLLFSLIIDYTLRKHIQKKRASN